MAQRRPGEHLCPALPVPRVRLPAGDEQRGLARDAEVRHSGAPWPVLLDPGEPCDICQYTSFRRLFAGLFVTPRNKDDMGDSTTTATVLTATATVTLCFLCFVCVCASFCPISYHKSTGGRSSSATSSRRRSTGRSRRVAAASRRSGRSARRAGAREARFVHVVDLAKQSRAMAAWWNPCTSGLIARQMEELEESFAAGPALQLSLFQDTSDWLPFVLLCFCAEPQTSREVDQDREVGLTTQCNGGLCVRLYSFWFTFFHKPTVAGDAAVAGGAGGALRAGASLVTIDVLTAHICSVSFCPYVPTEPDKYAFGLCRAADVQWTRTWRAGSRGSVTTDSVLWSCVVSWESLSQDDDGGLLHSRWTCSRSGRSARRAGPNAAGVLVILSKHTFYKRFHSSLCQRNYEQVRLVHLIVIAVPVPQIQEQIVDVIKVIPEEWMSKRTVQQIVAVPVPQIPEQIVEVIWGGCGSLAKARATAPVDVPTIPRSRTLRFDSECKRWNPEHVVLDLFSHITPSALLLSLCSSVG